MRQKQSALHIVKVQLMLKEVNASVWLEVEEASEVFQRLDGYLEELKSRASQVDSIVECERYQLSLLPVEEMFSIIQENNMLRQKIGNDHIENAHSVYLSLMQQRRENKETSLLTKIFLIDVDFYLKLRSLEYPISFDDMNSTNNAAYMLMSVQRYDKAQEIIIEIIDKIGSQSNDDIISNVFPALLYYNQGINFVACKSYSSAVKSFHQCLDTLNKFKSSSPEDADFECACLFVIEHDTQTLNIVEYDHPDLLDSTIKNLSILELYSNS